MRTLSWEIPITSVSGRILRNPGMSEEDIRLIQQNTEIESGGYAWTLPGPFPDLWIGEDQFRERNAGTSEEWLEQEIGGREKRGEKIRVTLQTEGMDDALLEKLQVLEGSIDALKDPNAKAIAIAVDTDDYGNPLGAESCPRPGEKVTVTYTDEWYYEDSRTGEPVTDATPEEYIQYHIEKSHDVEYTVCALVTIPYQISFRTTIMFGMEAVMGKAQLEKDSGQELYSLFYMFDTADQEAEQEAESFLKELTPGRDFRSDVREQSDLPETVPGVPADVFDPGQRPVCHCRRGGNPEFFSTPYSPGSCPEKESLPCCRRWA